MNLLLRLFGWPHELLHVLALRLIGRQPQAITQNHVDIPADLSLGAFVFVAGFPALVFWTATALSVQALFYATSLPQALVTLALSVVLGLGSLGTIGDILLIVMRVLQALLPGERPD
jgi:hypothetical protein